MIFRSMMKKFTLSLALVGLPFGAILVAPTVVCAFPPPLFPITVVNNTHTGGFITYSTYGATPVCFDGYQQVYNAWVNQPYLMTYSTNHGPRTVGIFQGCTVVFILDPNGNVLADVN